MNLLCILIKVSFLILFLSFIIVIYNVYCIYDICKYDESIALNANYTKRKKSLINEPFNGESMESLVFLYRMVDVLITRYTYLKLINFCLGKPVFLHMYPNTYNFFSQIVTTES